MITGMIMLFIFRLTGILFSDILLLKIVNVMYNTMAVHMGEK